MRATGSRPSRSATLEGVVVDGGAAEEIGSTDRSVEREITRSREGRESEGRGGRAWALGLPSFRCGPLGHSICRLEGQGRPSLGVAVRMRRYCAFVIGMGWVSSLVAVVLFLPPISSGDLSGPVRATVLGEGVDRARFERGCLDDGLDGPVGDLVAVASDDGAAPVGTTRYLVEVQSGIPVDPECFARLVEETLADPEGWAAAGYGFARVGPDDWTHLRVTLAVPDTVDRLCLPLNTAGIFSCWNGERAMLNLTRWVEGAETFGDDIAMYRRYMINHEVGHALGFGHRSCPAVGEPAPIMMQQTKTTEACLPSGRPTPSEVGQS